MSTDYDVYCLDCKAEHGFYDANHKDELMRDIIQYAELFANFAPIEASPLGIEIFVDNTARTNGSPLRVDLSFFAQHRGHHLVVRSEYGDIDDQCGKRFKCGDCDSHLKCARTKGHDGNCTIIRDDGKS
jgi:hypothetical protein